MGTSVNNKCKSFTSFEQSKKLAEILPIESADMIIVSIGDREGVVTTTMPKETFNMLRTPFTDVRNTISCWSLAAMLGVVPNPSLHKTFSGWRCDSYDKEGKTCMLGESADNQIDSCYELILKLHGLNLL